MHATWTNSIYPCTIYLFLTFLFPSFVALLKITLEEVRTKEPVMPCSIYNRIHSEIEEVGWENLVRLDEDLSCLSFRTWDKAGRSHTLEIKFKETYPKDPPSVAAAVPYMFNIQWSIKSRLRDVVQQFEKHLEKLEEIWSTLDNVDHSLWVVNATSACDATTHRLINIGDECFLKLFIDPKYPRSLPECRFLGPDKNVDLLRKRWRRNCKLWTNDKSIPENLSIVLDTQLPGPPDIQKNDHIECGICYAQCLPIDDEFGENSGRGTDYTCDNSTCSRAFHSICLGDWLRSISTTRQSFDVLFGNCPYCSGPVAVKINTRK